MKRRDVRITKEVLVSVNSSTALQKEMNTLSTRFASLALALIGMENGGGSEQKAKKMQTEIERRIKENRRDPGLEGRIS